MVEIATVENRWAVVGTGRLVAACFVQSQSVEAATQGATSSSRRQAVDPVGTVQSRLAAPGIGVSDRRKDCLRRCR